MKCPSRHSVIVAIMKLLQLQSHALCFLEVDLAQHLVVDNGMIQGAPSLLLNYWLLLVSGRQTAVVSSCVPTRDLTRLQCIVQILLSHKWPWSKTVGHK